MKQRIINHFKTIIVIDILFIIIFLIFLFNASATEKIYSRGMYPFFTLFIGRLSDIIRYSISEITVFILITSIVIRLFSALSVAVKKKRLVKLLLFRFIKNTIILISIIVIWFYCMWGFNYFRKPLVVEPKKNVDYTSDHYFETIIHYIISRANDLYVECPYERIDMVAMVNEELTGIIKQMAGKKITTAKRVKFLTTGLLARTNTLGMISPFFLESHLSTEIFDSEFPFTTAHEKVHLAGYPNETEANYLAFLICMNSTDEYLQYSALVEVLPYFLRDYKRRHTAAEYESLYGLLRKEIREEYARQHDRYERHKSKLVDRLWDLYDLYLKANKVESGVKAYSQVVDMILKSDVIDELMQE